MKREGTRMSLVIVLLVATLAVTAWMALRAQSAARRHRETAENVVRDWMRVAADELGRRAEAQARFYGTYRMLQIIAAAPELPTAEALTSAAKTPLERRNARLVKETFRFHRGDRMPRELLEILAQPPSPENQEPVWIADRVFVYTLSDANRRLDGFEVNRAALGPFFELAMTMRPILPQSLAEGKIANDVLAARATDQHGRLLFATGRALEPELASSVRGEEGLLRGVNVEMSIPRDTAGLFVAGGIPRELPIYAVLLVLTGALLATAILQIGRERALARMRSDFVASVSHELRTPLTQIRMFAETLRLDRVRSDEERRRSLAIIDQESRRLAQLVENVMQFSRGERGMLRVTPRPADVGAVVRDAVETFQPIAAARGMRVTTDIESGAVAPIDEDAIRHVVLNLLDNAAKYGREGQEIAVEVRRGVQISVEDEGPGVPARQRTRIWRRYVRLDRERERAIAGAGIGLAVVRDVVTLHGGKAWCESGARGGARFVVELPA